MIQNATNGTAEEDTVLIPETDEVYSVRYGGHADGAAVELDSAADKMRLQVNRKLQC